MARERPAARRGRLRRGLELGPLHGPRRADRAGRRGLDDRWRWPPARPSAITVGPFVLNVMNRHPAVVARMASTLQIASGGRLILGIGIGGAPKEHEAYGIDFPAAPERVARLEEAVAVIRALWTGGPGHARLAVLPAARGVRAPGPDAAAADHPRWRDAGGRAAGRPDRRWLVGVRHQLRGEPAALSRIARGERAPARGPAGARRVPGRLAERRGDRRHAVGPGAARDVGSAGRRPAPTARSSSPGRPRTSTRWSRRPGAGRSSPAVRGTISHVTAPQTVAPRRRPASSPS